MKAFCLFRSSSKSSNFANSCSYQRLKHHSQNKKWTTQKAYYCYFSVSKMMIDGYCLTIICFDEIMYTMFKPFREFWCYIFIFPAKMKLFKWNRIHIVMEMTCWALTTKHWTFFHDYKTNNRASVATLKICSVFITVIKAA